MSKNNIKKPNNEQTAAFFERLSMLLSSGIGARESLEIMREDADDSPERAVIEGILENLEKGERLGEAVENTGVFGDYVNSMISMGESSGTLDKVAESLAEYYARKVQVARDLKNSVTYPFVMVVIMIVVMAVLMMWVLPVFEQVFAQLGSSMNGIALGLLSAGKVLESCGLIILIIIVAIFVVGFIAAHTEKGSTFLRRIINILPIIRHYHEDVARASFAGGMGLCFRSGLDTFSGLDLVLGIIDHEPVRKLITQIKIDLEQGDNLGEALKKSGMFPPLYTRMIGIGFKSGSIDKVMYTISDTYDKKAGERLENAVSVLEPTMVIILSLAVGLVLLSVVLPLIGIMSGL